MERIIQLAASFPNESKAANDISGTLLKNLWDNLRHPPISYLGDESRYRAADGAGNVGYSNSYSRQSGLFFFEDLSRWLSTPTLFLNFLGTPETSPGATLTNDLPSRRTANSFQ